MVGPALPYTAEDDLKVYTERLEAAVKIAREFIESNNEAARSVRDLSAALEELGRVKAGVFAAAGGKAPAAGASRRSGAQGRRHADQP